MPGTGAIKSDSQVLFATGTWMTLISWAAESHLLYQSSPVPESMVHDSTVNVKSTRRACPSTSQIVKLTYQVYGSQSSQGHTVQ